MLSLCSDLGKAWIPISLGIYYTYKEVIGYVSKCRNYKIFKKNEKKKKYGVGGLTLDLRPRFQAFVIFL
jgi:hypothetical protein